MNYTIKVYDGNGSEITNFKQTNYDEFNNDRIVIDIIKEGTKIEDFTKEEISLSIEFLEMMDEDEKVEITSKKLIEVMNDHRHMINE